MMLAAMLEMRGQRAVLVGGGAVASRRAGTLLAAGMRVTVIAPTVCAPLLEQDVTVTRRPYLSGDLSGAALVVACTDDAAVNDRVTADALALGLLVNHAGEAGRGNLRFPLSFERAGVSVSVSTGRELPMLSQALRGRLLAALPEQLPLDEWSRQREVALTLPDAEREAALRALRADIHAHAGVSA